MLSQSEVSQIAYEKQLRQQIKEKYEQRGSENKFPVENEISRKTYQNFLEEKGRPSPKVLEVLCFHFLDLENEGFRYVQGEKYFWERYKKAHPIPKEKLGKINFFMQEAEHLLFGTSSTPSEETEEKHGQGKEEKFIDRSLIGTYYILIPNRREYKLGDTKPLLRVKMKIEEVEGELFMEYGYYDSGLFRGKLEWPSSGDFFSCTLINQKRPREVANLYAVQYDGKAEGSVFFGSLQAISKDNTIVQYLELFYKISESTEKYAAFAEKISFKDLEKVNELSEKNKISYDLIYILRGAFREAPSSIKDIGELNSRLDYFAQEQRVERKKAANYPSEEEYNFIQKYLLEGKKKRYYTYALDEAKGKFKRGQLCFYRNILGRVAVCVETEEYNGDNTYHSKYLSFDGDALRIVLSRGREKESLTISFNYRINQQGELYFLGFLNSGNSNYKVNLGPNLMVSRRALEGEECDENAPLALPYKSIPLDKISHDNDNERLIFDVLKSNSFKRMELPSYKTFSEMEKDYNENSKFLDITRLFANIKSEIPKIILGEYYWFYPSPHLASCHEILYRTLTIKEDSVYLSKEHSGLQDSEASNTTFSGQAFIIEHSCTLLLTANKKEEESRDPMLLKFWINNLSNAYDNANMSSILLAETGTGHHPVALRGLLVNKIAGKENAFKEAKEHYFKRLDDPKRYILTLEEEYKK